MLALYEKRTGVEDLIIPISIPQMTCMYGSDDTMPPPIRGSLHKQAAAHAFLLTTQSMNVTSLRTTTQALLQMPGPTMTCTTMSSPQSLLQRLERLDARLKQLEEKQRLPQSYFSADMHQNGHQVLNSGMVEFDPQCQQSLALALKDGHLKGTLVDRLKTLETRILQLNTELEKGSTASSSSQDSDEIRWVQNAQNGKQDPSSSDGLIRGPEKPSERSFLQLEDQKPKTVKESKESIGAGGKKTSTCRNKKKRLDNRPVYRRWFAIGC